jgi:hypothetical protein
MGKQVIRRLRLKTREGPTLIDFRLLFALIALMGLTSLTAAQHGLAGLPSGLAGPGP